MVTSSRNVAVGKPDLAVSGGLLVAPLGTPRPTSHTDAFNAAYVSAGYLSTDGVTESSERATEVIRAWGGDKVRTVQTEYGTTLSLTLIESRRAEALRLVFGDDNVVVDSTSGTVTVKRNSKVLPHRQFIIAMLDGEESSHLDVGYGQVTAVGDITYVDGEAISYELTISCDPDENGDTLLERKAADAGDAPGEG